MSTNTLTGPQAELKAIQAELLGIVGGAKAANRELSNTEMDNIEAKAARAVELKAAIDRGIKTAEGMEQFRRDGGVHEEDVNLRDDTVSHSHSNTKSGYLNFGRTAAKVAGQGIKSLIDAGSDGIPIEFSKDPIRLGQTGYGLLTLLPATTRSGRKYTYLAQSVRTNNAAVVAAGGTKPVSEFTVEEVENELEVIAHLSQPVDRFLLEDNDALERFLVGELTNGVIRKATQLGVQTISTTSGIQTVAYAGSAADSVYDGLTAVQDAGYEPSLIILRSADYKAIRKAKDSNGQYYAGGPFLGAYGDGALQQLPPLWGVQTLVSPDVAAGKALIVTKDQLGVSVDQFGIRTDVDKSTGFAKNEVTFRTEGRFAFDVFTPSSVALVSLSV